ncbi:putative E3 ubiquitin-protein ligase/polycomb group RING finger protein [Arabidopsis thaliana]
MEPENPQLFTLRSETPEKESVPAQTEDQSRERVSDLEQIQKEDSSEEICTESERMRKETELIETSLKQLEARENELREVEAKRKFFDLKEKELEEKEKELELKQRQVQERSIQDGPSVDAEPLTQQRNHNDEDKEKDSASVLSASVQIIENDEDHEPVMCVVDSEFNDFRKTMSSFMAGQVWALYDGIDSMPRCYGRIKKVNKCQSSLQVTWLEPKAEESVLAACGRFKWENTDTIQSHLAFSHEIHPIIRGKHFIAVNPSKGETWALFRDWSKSWNNDPEQHKTPYRYDFVEVLVSFDDSLGVGVAYLGKVQGFASVYKQAVQHGVISFMITPEEMQRFSHRVPSFRLNGDEKEGIPAGFFELDPAAIPSCTLEPDHFYP